MATILFGGTFDPPHNGHLRIAKAASDELGANVVFIPAKTPRWKTTEESQDDRLSMLKIALKEADNDHFAIDEYELKKDDGISYTIDTVRHFREAYPNESFYFLMGGDEANRFHAWKDAEELSKICQIVYCSRPDIALDKENIDRFNMMGLEYNESGDVSSSDIRTLKSVDAPKSVLDYIEENKLYYVRKIESCIGEKRMRHSLSVAHLAEKIIEANKLNSLKGKGYIAGAIHDLAKYLSHEEGIKAAKSEFPDVDFSQIPDFAIHQYAGVALAREMFGINDRDILEAVSCHCLAKKEMTPLSKILYCSDKIEPTRGYDSSGYIAACIDDYRKGYEIVLQANEDFLKEHGKKVIRS